MCVEPSVAGAVFALAGVGLQWRHTFIVSDWSSLVGWPHDLPPLCEHSCGGDAMKTVYVWAIVWRGEVVDTFETLKEARAMATEYAMAYGSPVSIKKVKNTA